MANKTYFKGKKKSTVKSKKYLFAGFDEATQIDNTGYLNALYNPKYFDKTGNSEVVSREASKNIESNKNIAYNTYQSSNLATNTYEDYNRAIENQRKQSEDAKKELQQKTKAESLNALNTNIIQSVKDPLLNFGKELVKKQVAKQVAKNAAVDAAMQSGTAGIWQSTANPTTAALTTAQSVTGSTVPAGVEVAANTTQAAATAGTQGAVNATTTAGSSAAGLSSAAYSGIAALGTLGGEGWKYLSNDQDPGTYTKKEKAGTIGGTILSRLSTGAGIGATAGSLIAPGVGTGIGALIGGAAGAVGGTVEGLIKNKKFKRQAEEIKRQEENERLEYLDAKRRNEEAYNKQLRLYDYTRNKVKNDITYQSELLRQNRLMGLTEGQLAGNTNIAMTGGGRKYFGKGGVNVPGGQVVPIGQGAVEFVGRSHAQGGIRLDAKTEVEGGETMDKVRMKNGKMNDYFFSKFLKYKGKSFAQHHKELIKRGASQEEIQALAKKQEAMANRKGEKDRSPKQVAEYGGIKKYQTGDFHQRIYTDPEEFKIANQAYQDSLEGFRKFPLLDGRGYGFSDNDISRPDFSSFNNLDTGFTNILNRDFANSLSICPSNMGTNCRGTTWVYKRPTEEPVYQDPDKIKYKPAPPLSVNLTPPPLRSNMMIESSPIGYRYQLHTGVKGSQVRVGYYKDGKYYPFSKERVQNEIEENRIPDQTEENYKKIQMQKQQQLKRNKTGGVKKYFTGGVRKYKTAGAVDDPVDPLIMAAIFRLGIDANPSNYKKEKTNDGVKIKHITTGKEIFFNNNEIKDLTSSKNTYGPGEAILRAATEEEMKQMQSDTNPSFWDYAKGFYNLVMNPFDAIRYENTKGRIIDDPANWLRIEEMDQQNNPNPVLDLLELAPTIVGMGAGAAPYKVTMAPKAPTFGLGTGSAIPKSLARSYNLARPGFTRPTMVPRVTAKQPAGTTVTTAAQRESARNASGSTAVGNRFYDNRYYGRGDFWGQDFGPRITVSGAPLRKINIPSYTLKPPPAGFGGGYIGPFREGLVSHITDPEYTGEYGTILNTGNTGNTGSNGSTENVDYNTGEYYKTDEERKAAEKIRQKVAEWASGYSGSTGRGGTGMSAGYTQSATSAAPPFTGSLALGTSNSNSTKGQNAKTDDKKDDKKDLNMPEDKKEAIPFNRDLANRLALLQIGAGLPSIIPPLIALGKDIPTPNWDPFTYNRIPSVGGAPAITAGSVAAPRLSRVDYSDKMTKADEMALAAMNKSAEAGPQSGILNMAILGKNYRQILELQKQETDENKKQSDIEKQLAAKVSESNRDAAMSAASKNAENILKTNDINSAINQANLGAELKRYEYISQKNDLEYRKNIEKYLTDLSALETLAGIPMQIASDTARTYSDQYLAYLASDPTSGVYDRYINAMLGREDKKKTGGIKKYTSRLGDLVKNPKLKSKII